MKGYKKSFKTKNKKSFFKTVKRVFLNRFFWLFFLSLTIIVGLVYLFLFSSVFKIKEFQILGCEKINQEEIKEFFASKKGINIFLVNFKDDLSILTKNYPMISQISLIKKFPNLIFLQIEERKPVIYKKILNSFSGEEELFLIDKDGVAFEKIFEIQSGIVKIKNISQDDAIKLGEQLMEKKDIENILKIQNKLNSINVLIEEIEIISSKRFNIKTVQGFEIYFNPEKNLASQLEKLEIILKEKITLNLRKNIEYIDLRFEKIYIYPENYDL